AARAVGYQLTQAGVKRLTIANRTLSKAEELAQHLQRFTVVEACSLEDLSPIIQEATLLINTTSVGMHPQVEAIPIPETWLHDGLVVSDLIYRPNKTRLLQAAEARGATIHNGVGMLVHQAAIAMERWFGQQPPIAEMR